ncbi:MAG: HD domain-containing protein [Gemmataceae bacterium]
MPDPALTDRFDRALLLASGVHRAQCRKGTTVPYVSHLLAVCALVLEHGGDEDQAIAALLHDAPEDQGGQVILDRIRADFGPRVAELVAATGEPIHLKSACWHDRKQAFLARLETTPSDALLIVATDKVHNLSNLLAERSRCGDAVFERFGGGREGTLWYYRCLAELLSPAVPTALAARLTEMAVALQSPA